jgi:MFS family permease
VTFVIYVGASSGLAVTHSYGLLIGLRCIQAAGSASVIAIGAGSIGDIAPPSERGGYMSFFSLGAMYVAFLVSRSSLIPHAMYDRLGPAAGPIAGGLLAQTYGWQATFAFLAVFGAIILIVMALFLPETLRAKVGDGSIPAKGLDRTLYSFFSERRHAKKLIPDSSKGVESLPVKTWRDAKPWTPFKLFGEKDVLLLLTFNSVGYTLFYCVITSTSTSLQATYGLSQTALGLCFIANGAGKLFALISRSRLCKIVISFPIRITGCIVASIMNGPRLNRDYRVVTEQLEAARIAAGGVEKSENRKKMEANDLSNFPIEHARLRSLRSFFLHIFVCNDIIDETNRKIENDSDIFYRFHRRCHNLWMDSRSCCSSLCPTHRSIYRRSHHYDAVQLRRDLTCRSLSGSIGFSHRFEQLLSMPVGSGQSIVIIRTPIRVYANMLHINRRGQRSLIPLSQD